MSAPRKPVPGKDFSVSDGLRNPVGQDIDPVAFPRRESTTLDSKIEAPPATPSRLGPCRRCVGRARKQPRTVSRLDKASRPTGDAGDVMSTAEGLAMVVSGSRPGATSINRPTREGNTVHCGSLPSKDVDGKGRGPPRRATATRRRSQIAKSDGRRSRLRPAICSCADAGAPVQWDATWVAKMPGDGAKRCPSWRASPMSDRASSWVGESAASLKTWRQGPDKWTIGPNHKGPDKNGWDVECVCG
ncbi:hypothetical protein AXG93_773s1530 [Marchantia polymorpha subsp. ruderalis]|uniref:Uncharacterized protein n=1 Tax=Marchantia polymorpha subsp. ruderalis TaxID=1480154 RepID=A0A176WB27_MARPO|nr:hypothetical protein AXG93_773s1530 [Marchantia polymorpha subsp. ruderalis]